MSWLELEGRVALVTGAAGGIGRAIATGLAQEGARVAAFDRDAAGLEALAEELGEGHHAAPMDLADGAAIDVAIAEAALALGPPDILVNVAAMSIPGPLGDAAPDDVSHQFEVNTAAALRTAQAYRRHRDPGRAGSIVNISSIAAGNPVPEGTGYSLGKAALTMMTRQLALEWGPEGIRCNLVSPGLILTPLSRPFYADPADRAAREAVVPLRRIGRPEDIADAVLFLASARSAYVTGADIVVDGGFTQTLMAHIPRRR